MEKLPGVIRVHPFGLNGKALVLMSTKEPLTMEKAKEVFEGSKLSPRKIERA